MSRGLKEDCFLSFPLKLKPQLPLVILGFLYTKRPAGKKENCHTGRDNNSDKQEVRHVVLWGREEYFWYTSDPMSHLLVFPCSTLIMHV